MSEKILYGSLMDQWNETRETLVQIAHSIPENIDYDWKPHPDMMSFGKILRHTVGAVYYMFKNYLKKEITAPAKYSEKKTFAKEEFITELERTDKLVKDFLSALTTEDMQKEAYSWEDKRYSVEWVVWNLKSHERFHSAQLKMYLKLMGIDTSKIGH